jgi:glycosyltransferase involved in cell wall biosynthesis
MKILFCPAHLVLDAHREGSELAWAYNIVDRLAPACRGSLAVTGRNDLDQRRAYRIQELTPKARGLNFGNLHALRFNLLYTRATFRTLRVEHFDVVHHVLPFAVGRTFNLALLRRRRPPFVIGPVQTPLAVPDLDLDPRDVRRVRVPSRTRPAGNAAALASPLLSVLSRRTVQHADRIVAIDAAARDLLESWGVADDRIVIIPAGVDCDRFKPPETAGDSQRPLNLLVVCHLVRRKNVAAVLRAVADARREGVKTRLSVVGDGPQLDPLRREAQRLSIERDVEFVGFVPHGEIHTRYRQADVFVNASLAESFSTTCLEAMASGIPAVSTSVGVFSAAIDDGHNGYLVPQGDYAAMAGRIVELSRNRPLLQTLGHRARAATVERFDWAGAVIPRYLELYRSVVESRRL